MEGNVKYSEDATPRQKRFEIIMFVFLTAIFWPVLSFFIVAGYGFLVWIYQMIAGPPGPPHM